MNNDSTVKDCYFCTVSSGNADPFIFENRSFIGIFDTNPVNPGHALVIPRRHVVSLFDLNADEQADYFDALRGVRGVIERTDLVALYAEMQTRDYLQGRPMDHIETVLKLPFLGRRPDAYTVGNNERFYSYASTARAKGVSAYQFNAPAEWFAELYMFHYCQKLPDHHPSVKAVIHKLAG